MSNYMMARKPLERNFKCIYSIYGIDANGFKWFQIERIFANPESARTDGWKFVKECDLVDVTDIEVVPNYPIYEVKFKFLDGPKSKFYLIEQESLDVVRSVVSRAFPSISMNEIEIKLITAFEMDEEVNVFAFERLLEQIGVKLS